MSVFYCDEFVKNILSSTSLMNSMVDKFFNLLRFLAFYCHYDILIFNCTLVSNVNFVIIIYMTAASIFYLIKRTLTIALTHLTNRIKIIVSQCSGF